MTKKLNVDSIAEPIELTIDGKEYVVAKLTSDLLNKVAKLAENKDDVRSPIKQLALLLGISDAELDSIDIRKIGKALQFITESIREDIEAKNPSGAEAK